MSSLLIFSLVSAEGEKVEVSVLKERFLPGEEISFKVSLFDSNNNPINGEVSMIFESADKSKRFESTAIANRLSSIALKGEIVAGYWTIYASYKGIQGKTIFIIETKEEIEFSIEGDNLLIKNTGNIQYNKRGKKQFRIRNSEFHSD